MPARIKNRELQILQSLLSSGNFAQFVYFSNVVLSKHGCSIDTHFINPEGWIMVKLKKEKVIGAR